MGPVGTESREFSRTIAGAALALFLLTGGCSSNSTQTNASAPGTGSGVTIHPVSLDEQGALKEPDKLQALLKDAKDSGVTDVVILAHGWNNSSTEAMTSYQNRAGKVQEVADRNPSLRPNPYKPLIIGLIWPSKVGDYGPAVEDAATTTPLTPNDVAALDASLRQSNPSSEAERAGDLATLTKLAQKSKVDTTPEDRHKAFSLFCKYAIKPDQFKYPTPEDQMRPICDFDATRLESIFSTIANGARGFTFWQMKQRAGIVGENGGAEILKSVMSTLPLCRIQLFGHSFGCKLILSAIKALPSDTPNAKVDTVVLLQGAISFQAFADQVTGINQPVPGGYKDDLKVIKGPVIATYSAHDNPLRYFYPVGARLANQVGELELFELPSRYSALGAVGFDKQRAIPIKTSGEPYGFKSDTALYSIDGSAKIPCHGNISDPAVSWIDWAAMVRN